MKTESDLKLEYLKDTGMRAEVAPASEFYCPECEETYDVWGNGVNISREYYEWLIEKATEEKVVPSKFEWLSLDKLPEHFSFRCLIKFEEFGVDGIGRNHVSTGYWWHRDKIFSIDFKEMKDFTPEYFLPIYSDLTKD